MPVVSAKQENAVLRQKLAEKDQQISQLTKELEQAVRELKLLRQHVERWLGRRTGKGERNHPDQLALSFDELDQAIERGKDDEPSIPEAKEAPDAESPTDKDPSGRKKRPRVDESKFNALPRERVVHELPESERICPLTGHTLVPVGEKITEELEYRPAALVIVEHARIQYGLPEEIRAEVNVPPLVAPMPPRPIEEGRPGAGLLARILVAKYVDHLPLHRQEWIFGREGLRISRQTLCEWVMRCAWLLQPVTEALKRSVLSEDLVLTDDTRVLCQENAKGAGKRNAFLWAYVGSRFDEVVYDFTLDRGHEVVASFLEGYRGFLVGDGYSGYHVLEEREQVVQVGCWAHAARKFKDALKEAPHDASRILSLIQSMYAIEQEATKAKLDTHSRAKLRQERSQPLLDAIGKEAASMVPNYPGGGAMAKALGYLTNQWSTLVRFVEDGRLPVDNNTTEQAMRRVAVGRKNWLFAGSERGGKAAATIYSLVETCRRLGIDPFEYLRDLLVRICIHPSNRVDELIPRRWKELRDRGELAPLPA